MDGNVSVSPTFHLDDDILLLWLDVPYTKHPFRAYCICVHLQYIELKLKAANADEWRYYGNKQSIAWSCLIELHTNL